MRRQEMSRHEAQEVGSKEEHAEQGDGRPPECAAAATD